MKFNNLVDLDVNYTETKKPGQVAPVLSCFSEFCAPRPFGRPGHIVCHVQFDKNAVTLFRYVHLSSTSCGLVTQEHHILSLLETRAQMR